MRRKSKAALSVLALSMCVAGAIFVIIASENLNLKIQSTIEGELDVSFVNVFFDFTNILVTLTVLTGAVISYFFASLNMSERRRDIGIMKSVGCLTNKVFGYFAAELCIIVFSSCALGSIFGVISSHIYARFGSPIFVGSSTVVNPWSLMIFLLVFLFASAFLGIQPIVRAIRAKTSLALSPRLSGVTSRPNALTSKLRFSFKIAFRTLLRKRYDTVLMIACFALVMILTTMMVAGTTIVRDTTKNYVKRAIGENVILIGHIDVSSKYVDLLSFFSPIDDQWPDFLDSKYQISSTLISELGDLPGIVGIDPRFVFETRVHEVQGVTFVGEDGKQPVFLGNHRSRTAMVHGIEPEHLVNEWLLWGRVIDENDSDAVILGDTLSSEIISYPSEQKIEILGKRFRITGVALDPFNAGLVVYAPLSSISPLVNQTGYNLLLVKSDSSGYSDIVGEIQLKLLGSDFSYVELDKIAEEYDLFFDFIWAPYVLLSLFFLGAAVFCLFCYSSLYIAEQVADFEIMRALGIKSGKIFTIVLTEISTITLIGGVTGVLLGFSLVFSFLMPDPVISHSSLISVILWLIFALSLTCISGFYSAFRTLGKSVA